MFLGANFLIYGISKKKLKAGRDRVTGKDALIENDR
jgi:hypothetical protein